MQKAVLSLLDKINSFLARKLGWNMTISGLVVLSLIVFLVAEIVFSSGTITVVVFGIAVAVALVWPEDKKEKNKNFWREK